MRRWQNQFFQEKVKAGYEECSIMEDFDIGLLFERGEVLENVPGNSCAKIFEYICDRIVVPSGLTAHQLQKEIGRAHV